ncbi:ferritin-like domain-containing protein [Sandaracinobacteroides saxicola]|uniref:Ferritin-like domain-containing protein n=1 Tax=Sandaracinobacteroides saxicola TaxID=2759707 RepID=A0A7G5IGA8_9SPHN|nr:ferritin-like domain-containing protein [Sandaracinobacteroides saxicola]QMW22400.1 ferritin-like domain-containing protein [Sandaracinobacteroides saxicola]
MRWTLDDIDWAGFDPARVDPDLLAVVKTASLVEANAADYVAYLRNVFADDPDFVAAAVQWGVEEEQHGAALARWAELADPRWSAAAALADFRANYRLDLDTDVSIRGSRAQEMIARQVVETGTSSFYSAIRDASACPVLREVAGRIAADEFHHYRLFRTHAERYAAGKLSLWARVKTALTRFQEAEDDELGWAWFAANVRPAQPDAVYAARDWGADYWVRAMALYRRPHIDNGVRMLLRAVGLAPNGVLFRGVSALLWFATRRRAAALAG